MCEHNVLSNSLIFVSNIKTQLPSVALSKCSIMWLCSTLELHMSTIFCNQTGTPVVRSLIMDPFRSCLMTRLSLNRLWRTMPLFLIQYSNAEINSLVYLKLLFIFGEHYPSIHPSIHHSFGNIGFFLLNQRQSSMTATDAEPKLLADLSHWNFSLFGIDQITLITGFLCRCRKKTNTECLVNQSLRNASPIPTTIIIVRVLWPPYYLPCFISFILMPIDKEMSQMDGSKKTCRSISCCCSNKPTLLIESSWLCPSLVRWPLVCQQYAHQDLDHRVNLCLLHEYDS